MRRFGLLKTKKGVALIATLVVVGAAAIGAYAYFTNTGSGSGTATVGNASAWTVTNNFSITGDLYPVLLGSSPYTTWGASTDPITGVSVTNSSANANEELNEVDASISVTNTSPLPYPTEAACSASDFAFYSDNGSWSGSGTDAASILPAIDETPGGVYDVSHLSLGMVDNGAPQDNCQGQTVTVTFSAK